MEVGTHARLAAITAATIVLAGTFVLQARAAWAGDLALKRVVLSSGGVGYYEYAADVTADETVTLEVPLDQVDDILASLVALSEEGRVAVAQLPGREPLDQYFAGRSFPQSALSSPADLLNAFAGSEIVADGPRPVRGRLVRVVPETTADKDGQPRPARNRVSVLATGGLQQFILEEADSVAFADPVLQAEVGDALAHIASYRAGGRRQITLKLPGSAGHAVRVGYVVEAPLWKTSYRLLLPTPAATGSARLQGWAVLENRSGADWKDVSLTLTSGSPVTFRQELYQSYMVPRPTIPVDLGSHVLPMADRGSVGILEKSEAEPSPPPPPAPAMAPLPAPSMAPGGASRAMRLARPAAPAEAADAPSQVSFTLPGPISLASGQSATLPIIDVEVPATRVSLYQPATSRSNPLAAVTLANRGTVAWPPGMLTLYEPQQSGGLLFVGDARLNSVTPGQSRFVSYAVDLKTQIAAEIRQETSLLRIAPADGVLQETFVDRQVSTFRLTGAADPSRVVLEIARPVGARLVEPAGSDIELTAEAWRIPLALTPAERRAVRVVVETDRREALQISEDSARELAAMVTDATLTPTLRAQLQPIVALRADLAAATTAAEKLDQEHEAIVADQERVRANMAALEADASLRRRYTDKLGAQESRLDAIGELQKAAANRVETARGRLLQAVSALRM